MKYIKLNIILVFCLSLGGCLTTTGGKKSSFVTLNSKSSSSSNSLSSNDVINAADQLNKVPFYTPTLVTTITPLVNGGSSMPTMETYAVDLSGNGGQNLVIAGRQTQPATIASWHESNISILGWQNDKLVDQTSQWFKSGENKILGTELGAVKFADLNRSGRMDMVVSSYTDMDYSGPSYVYFNDGNSFTRTILNLDHVHSHDTVIYDLTGSGYKDIIFPDYGPNTTFAMNNHDRTFTTYKVNPSSTLAMGTSSIAVGDFLNNGSTTLIATDLNMSPTTRQNKLYSWNINNNQVDITDLGTLPTPRFALPKWSSYKFGGSQGTAAPNHDIRVVAYDWDNSGIMDAIIISVPNVANGDTRLFSEIQFLKNNGHGVFSDETDNVLVGYKTNTAGVYNPRFLDINGDGLIDILLSNGDFSKNNSSQILLQTKDGKFVAAFQNVLTDFAAQSAAIQHATNQGNSVNIIKSPDNKLYLITLVDYSDAGKQKQAVYLSLIGSTTVTASEAVNAIKTKWPWMNDASANLVLSKTGATYLNGKIIDLDAALNPYGALSINSQQLNGFISGVKLSPSQSNIHAIDTLGRDFKVNISSMSNNLSAWDRNVELDQMQLSSQSEYLVYSGVASFDGMRAASDNYNWSLGTPAIPITDNIWARAQMTQTLFNPWVQFSGVWGSTNSASTMETVFTYRDGWLQTQLGLLNVNTSFNPGLVTKISNITAAWSEVGYTDNHFGFFAGVKPVILNGSIEANLPTSVDNQGNIHYTKTSLNLQSSVTGYVRALYTDSITKNINYKFYGMLIENGQYRIQSELRYSY
jgi:hypothetical protein